MEIEEKITFIDDFLCNQEDYCHGEDGINCSISRKYLNELNVSIQSQQEEIQLLNKIIKEAINLSKGIEPHSYSDYKNNKQ